MRVKRNIFDGNFLVFFDLQRYLYLCQKVFGGIFIPGAPVDDLPAWGSHLVALVFLQPFCKGKVGSGYIGEVAVHHGAGHDRDGFNKPEDEIPGILSGFFYGCTYLYIHLCLLILLIVVKREGFRGNRYPVCFCKI